MDKNLHNDNPESHDDNLEQFFRKGLAEDSQFPLEESDWDMPSDAVWDGIENGLPMPEVGKPSLRISTKYWWKVAAGILFIAFCMTTYFSQRKIDNLQEQVTVQSNQLKELQEKTAKTLESPLIQQSNSETKDALNSLPQNTPEEVKETEAVMTTPERTQRRDQAINSLPNGDKTENTLSVTTAIPPIDNGGNNTYANQSKTTDTSTVPLVIPFTNEKDTGEELQRRDVAVKDPLGIKNNNENTTLPVKEEQAIATLDLESKGQPLWDNQVLEVNEHFWLIEPIAASKKRGWYAGVFFAPTNFKATTKKNRDISNLPKGRITDQSSFEMGVRLGWQINDNWSLETGLTVAKNTNKINHQVSFNFDPNNEITNTEGNLESTYSVDLRTDYGDMPVELDLSRRPGQGFISGERIGFELENEIATSFLQIPLALRYGLQKGKFNISMSGGILLSALQSQQIDLPEKRLSRHPRLRHENSRIRGKAPKLNEVQYAIQTGIQLAYRPAAMVESFLAPTYTKGLTPVLDNEKVSTYLAQTSLQAGVNVRF